MRRNDSNAISDTTKVIREATGVRNIADIVKLIDLVMKYANNV